MAIDPICKMTVDEATATLKSEYKNKMYYFCAPGCKKTFEEDPAKYVQEEDADQGPKPCGGCCGCQ